MNDNKKICYLLNRLLAIYARFIRKKKLKYFLRYREKIILSTYSKYKKLNNLFKKRPIQYNNSFHNKNNKNINKNSNLYNNNNITNTPSKYQGYSLNRSESVLFTHSINNSNMAYLMTPVYIVDDDELNNQSIKEYNKKYGYYYSPPYPERFPERMFYRTKSSEFVKNEDPFYYTYMKNAKIRKNNDFNNSNKMSGNNNNFYSGDNKNYFPYSCRGNNVNKSSSLFDNNIKRIDNRSRVTRIKVKRPLSTDKKFISLNKNQMFYDPENQQKIPNFFDSKENYKNLYNRFMKRNKYQNVNNNKICLSDNYENDIERDIYTLGGENNNHFNKVGTRNKLNNSNKKKYIPFDLKKVYKNQNINRQILNHLYDNNYMNNNSIKRENYNFGIQGNKNENTKNNNNINKKNKNNQNSVLNTNTDKKNKNNHSIFKKDNDEHFKINNSIYHLFPNKGDNKEKPYNKILSMGKISSSNFTLVYTGKKAASLGQDTKKINNSNSINNNNNSNNSNSQSNNPGLNHISTNYTGGHSYYSSNRDNQKQINNINNNNNNKNNINNYNNNKRSPTPLEVSPVFVNEYFRDSIGKKSSNNSNKVSLQSLSDSKMLELAGHYGIGGDDSSSDTFQMNSIVHSKKKFYNIKYKAT